MALNAYHLEQERRVKEALSKQQPTTLEQFTEQFNRKNPNYKPPEWPEKLGNQTLAKPEAEVIAKIEADEI